MRTSLKRAVVLTLSFVATSMRFPGAVYAQPPKIEGLVAMFQNLINLIFPIGALVAMFMIVIGGYLWIISAGDPNKIKQAQGTITWAIIGLVFLGIFRFILLEVFAFLGV